ncbi:hypothetical protein L1887_12533 [Cichorium endivia]|nr:hypothetical protein L1887_12533 [Cichorium endivia]
MPIPRLDLNEITEEIELLKVTSDSQTRLANADPQVPIRGSLPSPSKLSSPVLLASPATASLSTTSSLISPTMANDPWLPTKRILLSQILIRPLSQLRPERRALNVGEPTNFPQLRPSSPSSTSHGHLDVVLGNDPFPELRRRVSGDLTNTPRHPLIYFPPPAPTTMAWPSI